MIRASGSASPETIRVLTSGCASIAAAACFSATLNKVFELDLKEGISQMVYPETGERGTAPFYLGERSRSGCAS